MAGLWRPHQADWGAVCAVVAATGIRELKKQNCCTSYQDLVEFPSICDLELKGPVNNSSISDNSRLGHSY